MGDPAIALLATKRFVPSPGEWMFVPPRKYSSLAGRGESRPGLRGAERSPQRRRDTEKILKISLCLGVSVAHTLSLAARADLHPGLLRKSDAVDRDGRPHPAGKYSAGKHVDDVVETPDDTRHADACG